MIHMPRRSVTRFFIPLIDVLLLLFGVFLLLPMVEEEGKHMEAAEIKSATARLETRVKELEAMVKLEPELTKVAALKAELERLHKLITSPVRERIFVRIIDVDKDGTLVYQDEARAGKDGPLRLTDEKLARYLIDKHAKQAGTRQLYYVFNIPDDGRFRWGDLLRARQWFAGAETSLPPGRKESE